MDNSINITTENISSQYDTIVLSGGSTKGFLSLGALQCAYDNFLLNNINNYIGTSSGAMICYLLIIGYTPIEIMVYISTNQVLDKMHEFNLIGMIQGRGACSYNFVHEHLEKMTINKIGYLPTLSDLKEKFNKTLVCVTHNLTTNKTEYLSYETYPKLPCITALRMSSNLPLVFETFRYNGNKYSDGGISDNFAIDIGEKMGEKIFGISYISEKNTKHEIDDTNIVDFIYNLMNIPITNYIYSKIERLDTKKVTILQLDSFSDIKIFDFNINIVGIMNMFSTGYNKCKKMIHS